MIRIARVLLCAAVAATAITFAAPSTAQADHRDDYWNDYLKWYDGSYRPYYHHRQRRHWRYDDDYGRRGRPYYRDGYYGGAYYGTPNFGYRDYYGSGGSVRVGPLRFGWR